MICSSQNASHPAGTTVRIESLYEHFPVRKQAALKAASKTLAAIKHVLQAYAYARPGVRLSVKVLKKPGDRSNWTYGPLPHAQMSEAAFTIAGKDVASQCSLYEILDNNDGEERDVGDGSTPKDASRTLSLKAFLPNTDAGIYALPYVKFAH